MTNTVQGGVHGGGAGIVHGDVTINIYGLKLADDPRALSDSVRRYLEPIAEEAILGEPIPRHEAQAVINHLERGPKRGVLVVGPAGVGKSSVIAQVTRHFVEAGWTTVALRLDRIEPTSTVRELGERLDLSDAPTEVLRRVAAGQRCLIVVDQLDAVSTTSGRHPDFFDRVRDLVADVRAHGNLHVVMGCREFDRREDHRIRRLTGKRGIAEKVDVAPLTSEVIREVVARADRDPHPLALTERQLRLLAVPFNLWLWANVVEQQDDDVEEDRPVLDTGRALLNAYWSQQSERMDERHLQLKGRWLDTLDELLDYMGDNRVPSAPYAQFRDAHREALGALISEHLIVRDQRGQRLAFPHETVFDYVFAQRFIARGRRLLDLLRAREQAPFLRTTVRQVLQHMRSGDSETEAYQSTLRELLMADDVRFHIKEAVLAWLADLDDPRETDWLVLEPLIEAVPEASRWLWERRTMAGPWFDLLLGIGYIEDELGSTDQRRVDRAVTRLHWAAESRPEPVAHIVRTWLERERQWPERIARVMKAARGYSTPKWIDLYLDFSDRHPEVAAEHLHHDGCWLFDQLPAKAPDQALRVAIDTLERSLGAWWSDIDPSDPLQHPKPLLSLDRFGHDWHWSALARQVPLGVVQQILPLVVRAVRVACHHIYVDPTRPLPSHWWWTRETIDHLPRLDWIWLYPRIGPIYGDARMLVSALESALRLVSESHPDAFTEALSLLQAHHHYLTPAYLLLRAVRHLGPDRADWVCELLIDNPHLLDVGYSDASHWVSREALEAVAATCSPAMYVRLERCAVDYATEYERTRWLPDRPMWVGSDGRMRQCPYYRARGSAQLALLGAFPEARLSRAAKRRLNELRRRFGREDAEGPTGVRGGMVGPPFSAPWARLTDRQWLDAMRRHATDDGGRSIRDLEGGARELAGPLRERVAQEPARFAALCLTLPADINPTYVDAILSGLRAAAKEERRIAPDAIWRVVRYALAFPGRPCGWTWDLIVAYADAAVPDDVLDSIVWYATGDLSPRPDKRSFTAPAGGPGEDSYDASTHGLDTVRGGMADVIGSLLFERPDYFERLQPAIEGLVNDQTLAVRTQAPDALLPMLNFDADRAVEYFLTLCAFDHDSVTATMAAQEFLGYACNTHLDRLRPLLDRMLASAVGEVRRAAAQRLAVAIYRERLDHQLMHELWQRDDPDIQLGLVEVARRVVVLMDHERQPLALEVIQRGFELGDEVVAPAAARVFWHLQQAADEGEISLASLAPLFEAFIASPTFESNRRELMYLLKASGARLPDIVLLAFEKILASEAHTGWLDTTLIYRLYEDSPDPAVRRRCLDLIDELLRRGDYSLQQTLRELDGPASL